MGQFIKGVGGGGLVRRLLCSVLLNLALGFDRAGEFLFECRRRFFQVEREGLEMLHGAFLLLGRGNQALVVYTICLDSGGKFLCRNLIIVLCLHRRHVIIAIYEVIDFSMLLIGSSVCHNKIDVFWRRDTSSFNGFAPLQV